MINVKLTISYDGTDYCGFQSQIQEDQVTIESELKKAIQKMDDTVIDLYCGGRTDSGVHAIGQVVNFFSERSNMLEDNWLLGLNTSLPKDIRINNCEFVDASFNARRSAIYREYEYKIINDKTISALQTRYNLFFPYFKLNRELLLGYLKELLGENDYSAFCSINDKSPSKVRYLEDVDVKQEDSLFTIKVVGSSFLQHMVRIILGTLLLLHRKKAPASEMKRILLSKNRREAGMTSSSQGLLLKKVHYDETVYKKHYILKRELDKS